MKNFLITCICATVLSLLFVPVLQAKQERRLALLIGNSHYKHGGSLPNPVNDVRAIKNALESLGFTVMKYENCTQKEMKMAMDYFGSRLKGYDVGLFFYAGHGVQVSRYNYLIPVDAKLSDEKKVEYNCVRADRVLAEMEIAGSRTNIVILDACRDNPFERSWRRGSEGAGLAFMNAPSGSLIAYSTAPGKTALDGVGRNSPYTSALLQHIKTPNITVIEIFQGVRSTVMAKSGSKQIPWESTSLRGNFYFSTKGKVNGFSKKQAWLETERREFEQTKLEFEQERQKSKSQEVELSSVPQKLKYIPSSPPVPAVKKEVSPELTGSIPLLSELPNEIRGKIGKLQINVHSYSAKRNERLVFINMHRYKAGDKIGEGGPLLKEITPDGVIIDYGEGEARLLQAP